MIQLVGLLGLVAFVAASLVVGLRVLVLATRTRQLPELAISMSMLLSGAIGTGLLVLPLLVPDPSIEAAYYSFQAGSASNHIGFALLFLFVWRVFRPREVWAAGLFTVSTLVLWTGGIGTAIHVMPGGGIPGRDIPPDLWFWLSLCSRFVVYGWATFESFHYYAMLKRRLALGLADPVVADRFFYWGVCTSAVFCIWLNLAARAAFMDLDWVLAVSDLVSALLGFVVAGSLSLAFFPRKNAVENPEASADSEMRS